MRNLLQSDYASIGAKLDEIGAPCPTATGCRPPDQHRHVGYQVHNGRFSQMTALHDAGELRRQLTA